MLEKMISTQIKSALFVLFCWSIVSSGVANSEEFPHERRKPEPPHSYKPPQGYVADEKTAVAIAKAIFVPIYGKEKISLEEPFTGKLVDDKWIVIGTQVSQDNGTKGGVAVAEIDKQSGCILRVSHGK